MLVQATRTKIGVKTWPRLPHKVWILYIVIVKCHSGFRLVPGISSSCRLLSVQESNCGNVRKDPLSQPQQTNGKGGGQRACSEGRAGTQWSLPLNGPGGVNLIKTPVLRQANAIQIDTLVRVERTTISTAACVLSGSTWSRVIRPLAAIGIQG